MLEHHGVWRRSLTTSVLPSPQRRTAVRLCGGPDRVRGFVHMSVALQRHRGISRAMIRASASMHDLLRSAAPPWAVVPSRQEALASGIALTLFEGWAKLTGHLLVANLEGSPIVRCLLYIQDLISWLYKIWQDVSSIV